MFYDFMDSIRSPALRRILAALGLIATPIAIVLVIVLGLIGHTLGFVGGFLHDLYDLFRDEVPAYVRELFTTVRTGVHPYDQ